MGYNGYTVIPHKPQMECYMFGLLGLSHGSLGFFKVQGSSGRNLHRKVEEDFFSEVPHTNVVSGENMAVMISCICYIYIYIYDVRH